MDNLNKKTKETFDNIKLSDKRSNEIMLDIINKKHKKTRMFLKPIIISSFILLFGIFGIVHADDIVRTFNTFRYKFNGVDYVERKSFGTVELNYDADIPEVLPNGDIKNTYSFEEVEKKLGIKLLKSKYFKKDTLGGGSTKKNGKIADIGFSIKNFTDYDLEKDHQRYIEMFTYSAYMKTKYSDDLNDYDFFGGAMDKPEEYYIKSLDTTALIITYNRGKGYHVMFDYDNVRYTLHFDFLCEPDKRDNAYKRVTDILESLHY